MLLETGRQDQWALFLDFDGTLVDIAEEPNAIVVDPSLVHILTSLKQRFNGALAIISGRPIETLDRYLDTCPIDAAGLHGLEIRVGGNWVQKPEKDARLRDSLLRAEEEIAQMEGVVLEDKTYSLALHWRRAPQYGKEVAMIARQICKELGNDYRLQEGKAVLEIIPSRAEKGHAIAALHRLCPYQGKRPVFIGDDVTDESGFNYVNEQEGISVRVGGGPTAAHYKLESPHKLRELLQGWVMGESIVKAFNL